MSIGILGGGLSGITLQYLLNKPSEVLEKEAHLGGLCRTFSKNNFQYDIGGHILFSKDQTIMNFIKEVLENNLNSCKRNNKILYKGKYIKYPFENGIGALEKEDVFECLTGFINNTHSKPSNFKEWIEYTFGDGFAKKYLIPYNEKIWKTNPTEMALGWVERIPKPPVEDILKSALGIETEGYTHQLYFNYPTKGGIESLVHALTKPASNIAKNFNVTSIRKNKNEWMVSDGTVAKNYEKIVVTFPIHHLLKCLENIPADIQEAVRKLRYNTINVALIGVNNETLLDKSAIYIPDPNIICHRVCYMGYFSKNTIPAGKSSLIAEITTNSEKPLSKDALINKTIEDLSRVNIISKSEVCETDLTSFQYGYVIYDNHHEKNLQKIKDYFASIGIILHGRFAEFEYINMDEVIKRSLVLAEKLNYNKN